MLNHVIQEPTTRGHVDHLRPKSTLCYTPQLEKIAQEFIERKIIAKKNPENDQMGVDFLDDLYKWSLESVACLALNTRLGKHKTI